MVNSVSSVHWARVLGMPMRPGRAHARVLDHREGQRCRGSPDRRQSPVFGCGAAWSRPVPLTSGVARPPATALEVGTATLTAEYVADAGGSYTPADSAPLVLWSQSEAVGKVSHELLGTRLPRDPGAPQAELLDAGHWEGELEHTARDGRRLIVASRWALRRDHYGHL
jgi:hypothetical protein